MNASTKKHYSKELRLRIMELHFQGRARKDILASVQADPRFNAEATRLKPFTITNITTKASKKLRKEGQQLAQRNANIGCKPKKKAQPPPAAPGQSTLHFREFLITFSEPNSNGGNAKNEEEGNDAIQVSFSLPRAQLTEMMLRLGL